MIDRQPRNRHGWLGRWWLAVIGVALGVSGALVYEGAEWSIPRGSVTYTAISGTSVLYSTRSFGVLQYLAQALVAAGLVAVALRVARRAK